MSHKYFNASKIFHDISPGLQMMVLTTLWSCQTLTLTLGGIGWCWLQVVDLIWTTFGVCRTLSEFWHWFVANIPGDSVDDGEVIFDLLFPLVLPEGDGDHRFGYFVLKQPRRLDYSSEGGPTDACSPNMSKGRGPRRSVKDLIRRYDLELTASTFLIIDSDPTSLEIACEWQRCMGGQVIMMNLNIKISNFNLETSLIFCSN